jgi:hypothetical protein
MTSHTRLRGLLFTAVLAIATPVAAQETVTVGLPSTVAFDARTANIAAGSPDPTTVSFSNASLVTGRVLRVSVMPDTAVFSGPGGTSYPAEAIRWTVSNVSGGVAASGRLTSGVYTQIFVSHQLTSSGGFDISWSLDSAIAPKYAGIYSMPLRWKLESVQP